MLQIEVKKRISKTVVLKENWKYLYIKGIFIFRNQCLLKTKDSEYVHDIVRIIN